jgi:fructokinase
MPVGGYEKVKKSLSSQASGPEERLTAVGGSVTKILCCGEALIDFLPRTGADGKVLFEPCAGGSIYNVAIALGRLGVAAGYFGGLSTDLFGEMLREGLRRSSVDFSMAPVSDRPSTLAFVKLEGGNARYAFFDEGSAGRMLTAADLPRLPASIKALHFGSFSLASEPCGSAYEALMMRERGRGVIALDPNIRPTLIGDRQAYMARLGRSVAIADIVKLSEDDLVWLAPGTPFEALAADWLVRGAKLIVLTRGGAGASAISATASASVQAKPITVADTVGAGDTFSAALLAWLDEAGQLAKDRIAALTKDELASALGFASRAAAIAVSRPGADPPWRRELA